MSDVQPGLETRGRPKPQGLILAPDLETGDCEDWAAEAGVWPPVTICILQPRPMRGQDWGHVIWLDQSEASVSLSASSRQWGDQLSSPDGTQLHGRGQRLGLGE